MAAKIAVDGTVYTAAGKGAARYFSCLFREIAEVDKATEYHLFVDRNAPYLSLPQQANFHYRPVCFRTNLYWRLWQFREILRREHFDLVHYPSESRCFVSRCPSVVTVHEIACSRRRLDRHHSLYQHISNFVNERVFRHSIVRARAIVAVSNATRNELAALYPVDRTRITVVHEAPDPRLVRDGARVAPEEVRARLGVKAGYVLSFATGDSRENVDVVLLAFSKACRRVRQDLVLCGCKDVTQAQLRTRCHELGLAGRVVLLGFVDDATLGELYRAADLFVDISYYEGFGLQACEAMACGVPVIASRIPAFLEVLDDAADFVSPDDASGLSATIERILADRPEWLKRSRRSLERARAFSWRQAAERTVAIYRTVVGGP